MPRMPAQEKEKKRRISSHGEYGWDRIGPNDKDEGGVVEGKRWVRNQAPTPMPGRKKKVGGKGEPGGRG